MRREFRERLRKAHDRRQSSHNRVVSRHSRIVLRPERFQRLSHRNSNRGAARVAYLQDRYGQKARTVPMVGRSWRIRTADQRIKSRN